MADLKSFVSDKFFLDQAGLQALIKKIAGIKESLDKAISGSATDLADVVSLVDNILAWADDEKNSVVAKGLLKNVIDAAQTLRDELGEKDAVESTIYARLAELEKFVEDLDQDFLEELRKKAFVDVDSKYDADAQKVTITFTTSTGATKEAVINTSDFIVHGLMDGVKVVNYDGSATEVDLGEWGTVKVPTEVRDSGKYLVFKFKVAHDHEDDEKFDHSELDQLIWVSVTELFSDYDFEGKSTDEDYIKIDTVEDESNPNTANRVTITVSLGDAQKKVNALVEGVALKPNQGEGGETYKGIVELNEAVEAINTGNEELAGRVDVLEETVGNDESGLVKDVKDLTDRVETAEGKIDSLEEWTSTRFINIDFINDYFDYVVEGKGTEPKPGDEKYQ